jgi:hypothetical protein
MEQKTLVIRPRSASSLGWIILSIISVFAMLWAIFFLVTIGWSSTGELITGLIVILLSPLTILSMINRAIWKLIVNGEEIIYWSLFRKLEFNFGNIEKVEFDVISSPRSVDLESWRIFINGQSKRRPIIIPHKAIGFEDFSRCLRERDVEGA